MLCNLKTKDFVKHQKQQQQQRTLKVLEPKIMNLTCFLYWKLNSVGCLFQLTRITASYDVITGYFYDFSNHRPYGAIMILVLLVACRHIQLN